MADNYSLAAVLSYVAGYRHGSTDTRERIRAYAAVYKEQQRAEAEARRAV